MRQERKSRRAIKLPQRVWSILTLASRSDAIEYAGRSLCTSPTIGTATTDSGNAIAIGGLDSSRDAARGLYRGWGNDRDYDGKRYDTGQPHRADESAPRDPTLGRKRKSRVEQMTLFELIERQPHYLLVHRASGAVFKLTCQLCHCSFTVALFPYKGGRFVQTISPMTFHIVNKQLARYFTRENLAASCLRQLASVRLFHLFTTLVVERAWQPGPAARVCWGTDAR